MSSTVSAQRLFAARPRSGPLVDAAIAAVALAGTLAQLSHGGVIPTRSGAHGLTLTAVMFAVGATVPLVAWRRYPLGVFVATAGVTVVQASAGYPVDLTLGPVAALYLLATSRDRVVPWTGRTTATVVGLFLAVLAAAGAAHRSFPGIELLHTGLAWAVAWFAGDRTRLRREQLADLGERARRAERDAVRERLLVVAEERARIARDLHDSAGHAINVITVRAGAARLHHDPARSLATLAAIEDLARQTAAEIDQLVGSLREAPPDGTVEAPPGLASFDTLVAHHTEAGLDVSVATSGTPRTLTRATDQAMYRILQEALTNAARHGTGSARIDLAYGDTAVELTVTNSTHPNGSARCNGGRGLIGMRERAALLGGTLHSADANGVFRVHLRIPDGSRHP
jgi:signal transduction histidine kinase